MNASRLVGIPMDHLVAEVAAFPLASEAALELGLTALDPVLPKGAPASSDSRRLWRAAEREFLGHFPAFSVDEAVAIRDSVWFPREVEAPVALHTYLRRLAAWFLEVRGALAVPRLPPDFHVARPADQLHDCLAREQWRWLALALPPDLLLGALGELGGGPERIELMAPLLDRHLRDHKYAETHLHLGAAFDFSTLWVATLRALADPGLMQQDALCGPGACLNEGRLLAPWLIRAAVARYLLAAFLINGDRNAGFDAYLESIAPALVQQLGQADFGILLQGLAALRAGTLLAGDDRAGVHAGWKGRYAQLISSLGRPPALSGSVPASIADHLETLLPTQPSSRSAEVWFVASALAYLEYLEVASLRGNATQDDSFTQLFWQVTRVRALFYRHMIQRPMTPGLTWFIRFFGRLSPARKLLTDSHRFELAAELGGEGRGLRSLEVRTSPPTEKTELRTFVEALDKAACAPSRSLATAPPDPRYPTVSGDGASAAALQRVYGAATGGDQPASNPGLEVGIVFHFTKDRGGEARNGWPAAHWHGSHADPVWGSNSGYRFAHYYQEKRAEAETLAGLLREYPLVVEIVRGVDVCTDEIGVPNWVLAPLLTYVRSMSEAAAGVVRRCYGLALPGLRTSVHAGEDFVHLLTGLRQVDEAIEGFHLHTGDRIGHGVALGVDAQEWARRAGRIPMLCEERLFNLVWEWSWYGRGGHCADHARHPYLDREIARLSEQVFGEAVEPYKLEVLRRDLYDSAALQSVGFPTGSDPNTIALASSKPVSRPGRLYQYLTDGGLFQRGRAPIWIDANADGALLAHLQAELRHKVGTCGLTVEINPTSNLLIGNLGDLTSHPLWRLRPPRAGVDAPPVSVCVGSDDPAIFGSNLRHEYQALYDAMLLGGMSDEEARQWLDRTRESGLETRFTLAQRSGKRLFDPSAINDCEFAVNPPP